MPSEISGSSIHCLTTQGLDVHFGRADYRMRKQPNEFISVGGKWRRAADGDG